MLIVNRFLKFFLLKLKKAKKEMNGKGKGGNAVGDIRGENARKPRRRKAFLCSGIPACVGSAVQI